MTTRPTCSGCGIPVSRGARRCRPCAHRGATWSPARRAQNAVYWTPERRQAEAERARRWHAAHGRPKPKPAPKPRRKSIRGDAWTAAEDQLLAQLAGTMPLAELLVWINQRSRFPRSRHAVQARACHLGISLQAPGTAATGICALFRASPYTVDRWLKAGYLTGRRLGTGRSSPWLFSDEDIRRFIRTHPLRYERSKISSSHWRAEAEVVWRSLGLITTQAAADYLGLSLQKLHEQLIRPGRLAAYRGRHPTRLWQYLVKRRDVMELRSGVSA